MKLTLTLILLAALGGATACAAEPKKDDPQPILDRLPQGAIIERDIVYATNGDRQMLLDVYRLPSDKPLPLVIWIYGGAWDWGWRGCRCGDDSRTRLRRVEKQSRSRIFLVA